MAVECFREIHYSHLFKEALQNIYELNILKYFDVTLAQTAFKQHFFACFSNTNVETKTKLENVESRIDIQKYFYDFFPIDLEHIKGRSFFTGSMESVLVSTHPYN